MSKLRVHDMAGEFGISADEVMGLLRQMDVPVRSHLSPLTDDQVARVRDVLREVVAPRLAVADRQELDHARRHESHIGGAF